MIMEKQCDYLILGAGIYGLYSALFLVKKGYRVAVLEHDGDIFTRASYVNQARVHMGYHYPRSFTTALKSAGYFHRFCRDFSFAINDHFTKVYGIAARYSLTSGEQFKQFCRNAGIPCREIDVEQYYNRELVERAFLTQEYAFDPLILKQWFAEQLNAFQNFSIFFNVHIKAAAQKGNLYSLTTNLGCNFTAPFVVNATYASINQVIALFEQETFPIKYEISEIILCDVSDNLRDVGLTLMDGPFFSVMPFGLQGCHSLTSVTFTHHKASYSELPEFACQAHNADCSPLALANCNTCPAQPQTSWVHMHQLARKYLQPNIQLSYRESLFAIKPILQTARLSDARPTVIVEHNANPRLISVLSGKINAIYDLDEVLI